MGNELKKVYIDNDGVEWDLEEDMGCDEDIEAPNSEVRGGCLSLL